MVHNSRSIFVVHFWSIFGPFQVRYWSVSGPFWPMFSPCELSFVDAKAESCSLKFLQRSNIHFGRHFSSQWLIRDINSVHYFTKRKIQVQKKKILNEGFGVNFRWKGLYICDACSSGVRTWYCSTWTYFTQSRDPRTKPIGSQPVFKIWPILYG